MKVFILFIIHSCAAVCCLYCAMMNSNQCINCQAAYYKYKGTICLTECPTGFNVSGQNCVSSSNLTVFDLKFYQFSDLSARTVGEFSTEFGVRFSDDWHSTPVPTLDRGFYSASNSRLISSVNWVPGPDMTFMFWAMGSSQGTVFQVSGQSVYVQISLTTNYTLVLRSYQQANGGVSTDVFYSNGVALNVWQYVKLQFTQNNASSVTVNMILGSNVVSTTVVDKQLQVDSWSQWIFGNPSGSGSFSGFLYEFRVDNQVVSQDLDSFVLPACGFGYYVQGASCLSCKGTCSWSSCISSNCSICVECEYCSGYSENNCACGGSSCCQSECLECSGLYTCLNCISDYTLVNGQCVANAPDINVTFSGNFAGLYGDFQTGSSSSTYYFKSNPQNDDPIPVRYRGLYFTNGSYLEYTTNVVLNSDFTIALWVKYYSGGILYKGSAISFDYSQTQVELHDSWVYWQNWYYYYRSNTLQLSSYWTFLSIAVSSLSGALVTTYFDNAVVDQSSTANAAFTDHNPQSIILGKSSSSNLQGFIYSFKLWQFYLSDFSYEFLDEACGESLSSACLSECPINFYQSGYCTTCASSCNWGCVDARTTCTICSSYLCALCDNFDTSICLQCISNASGTPCKCDVGYYEQYYLCNLCYSRCFSCTDSTYACTTCTSDYKLCQNLCVSVCPTGFTELSNTCSQVQTTVLSLDFRSTFELGTISGFTVGSSNSNVYPNFDVNDPWPAVNRGFYFSQSSFLSGSLTFAPFFCVEMWINAQFSGKVFEKTGLISVTAMSQTSYDTLVSLMNGNNVDYTATVASGWVFFSVSLSFLNKLSTQVTVSINCLVSGQNNENGFVSDGVAPELYIGKTFGGFTGFIATITVYTDSTLQYSSFNLACSSGSCSYLLSPCTILQDPFNNCNSCLSDSVNGCRNGISNLCFDPICSVCQDRVVTQCIKCNEYSSGYPCTCDTFYFAFLGNCNPCYQRCQACVSFGFWCTKCRDSKVILNQYCIDACPTGFDLSGGVCTNNNFQLAFIELNNLINLGEIQGFTVGSVNNNTYPIYDPNDPWPSYERGYYFPQSAYMSSDCVLAPNLTLTFWVLIETDGVLLSKSSTNSSILIYSSTPSIFFNISLFEASESLNTNYNFSVWSLFSISVYTEFNTTTITLYASLKLVSTVTVNSYISDGNSTFFVGSSKKDGFLGFFWFLWIYQKSVLNSTYTPAPVNTCPVMNDTANCSPCPAACKYSCANSSCDLCPDKLCYSCSWFNTTCETCKPNSTLISSTCVCDAGFYSYLEECPPCYKNCKTCSFKFMSNCTACSPGLYLLTEGLCGQCGLGFMLIDGICLEKTQMVFSIDLNNTIKGVILDSVNGFKVVAGANSQFYPNYDAEDPYVAYLRGYYFNGNGSFMSVSNKSFVLPHKFEVEFWLNPMEGSGVIFSKGSLLVSINNFYVTALISLSDSELSMAASDALIGKTWSYVIITYTFVLETTTVHINGFSNTSFGYFIDNSTSGLFGKGEDQFFQGFLYTFTIFSAQYTTRMLLSCLEACDQCLASGYCIPTCLITEFWSGPEYNNCTECMIGCSAGCRSSNSCSLCADEKCESCDSLEPESECNSCFANSELSETCECNSNYYWNPINLYCFTCESNQFMQSYSCINCTDLCLTCTDLSSCQTCVTNAELSNSMCYCSIGYIHATGCLRHVLGLTLEIDSTNQASLQFNESLQYTLASNDLQITVNGTWELIKFSDRYYKLTVTYLGPVSSGEVLILQIMNSSNFVSVTNATLSNFTYQVALNPIPLPVNAALEAAKQLAQTVTTAVTSAVTATSMMNPNPACLWSFINTIQMIVFIVIANVSIPSKSKGLIIGLKNYNFFPNVFEYFLPAGDAQNNQNAYDLGYKTDSVLMNVGKAVTAFAAFMVLWLVLVLLNLLIKKGVCTKKLFVDNVKEFLADYKYGFFIRYGITNYIEFEIAAMIGILNYKNSGAYSVLNSVFASIVLLVLAATPVLCFVMVMKRKAQEADKKEEFETMYGTLFYEFNNDKGLMTSNFYVFFFIKRGIYGMILIFLSNYGVVQMTTIVTICFAYLLYLISFKPFGEKLLNISNIFSEIATLLIFILITWLLFDLSQTSRDRLDNVIYYLVYTIMGIQMAASIGLMIKTIKDKIAAKKKAAVIVPVSQEDPEVKNLNIVSNSNDVSRVEFLDDARSRKTASNFSKYGRFFEE